MQDLDAYIYNYKQLKYSTIYNSDSLEIADEITDLLTKLDDNPDYVSDAEDFNQEFYDLVDKLYELSQMMDQDSNKDSKGYNKIRKRPVQIKEEKEVYDN